MELSIAKENEFDEYYKLKADASNIFWTGWLNKPDYEKLKEFYLDVISNQKEHKSRKMYLAHEEDKIIGYIYIDYVDDETFEISPAISSEFQGKGFGKRLINLAIEEGLKLGFKNMEAYIREDNIASQKCFEYNGAYKTNIYNDVYIENQGRKIKMFKYCYNKEN